MAKKIKDTKLGKTIDAYNKEYFSGVGKTLSVSSCLSYIGNEFDSEKSAKACHDRDVDNPDGKYYNMSVDDILKAWKDKADESIRYGKLLDDYVGLIINEVDPTEWKLDNNFDYDERLRGICEGFDQVYKLMREKTDYEYVTREKQLFIQSSNGGIINGRCDYLWYSPSLKKYSIWDWKTTEKIERSGYLKLKGPCISLGLDDCKMNIYTLQLHLYKKALVETYKICDYDSIDCFVCKMSYIKNENGTNFQLMRENFKFDSEFLDKVIDFGIAKNNLKKKRKE